MNMLQTILSEIDGVPASQLGVLAEVTGVPVDTIIKLRNGQTSDPRISTVEPIYLAIMQGRWRAERRGAA